MKGHPFRSGFTLVEVLMSLAISAVILSAVALAFNASAVTYQKNQELHAAVNNGRQALLRMMAQLRTGFSVDPNAPANKCNFFAVTGPNSVEDLTYEFRTSDNTLYLITNSNAKEYVLCTGVQSLTFDRLLTADASDCRGVAVTMTVQSGDQQETLSSAVAIRRNLEL
ncbi:MAG: prepilin-type N-terminal cleavage/methylation domain-containing protein [Planctomycetes bacterium]|nr:prepilin-type N-terminal cleavage/methylation domain-containing protein [Planctomycetota bacterium]